MLVSLSYYANHGNVLDFPASLNELNKTGKMRYARKLAGGQAKEETKSVETECSVLCCVHVREKEKNKKE